MAEPLQVDAGILGPCIEPHPVCEQRVEMVERFSDGVAILAKRFGQRWHQACLVFLNGLVAARLGFGLGSEQRLQLGTDVVDVVLADHRRLAKTLRGKTLACFDVAALACLAGRRPPARLPRPRRSRPAARGSEEAFRSRAPKSWRYLCGQACERNFQCAESSPCPLAVTGDRVTHISSQTGGTWR
ncbi:hypothetical protein BQ8482_380186 [Mesorhizobium delmotii]|uniref:Uncharacterized protein n=1 Tax=Mesorhizobium delmotii TaxID=1631247 RepID=A0A2P9ASB0_9HYPH|nr:hypothetical protein BQ8482_380186 [Mesorhizobium delmotii]